MRDGPVELSADDTVENDLPVISSPLGRWRPLITRVVLPLAVLVVGLHLGGGWYFSNQIRSGALTPIPPPEPNRQFEVLAVTEDTVGLSATKGQAGDPGVEGIRGVVWPTGHGIVGDVLSRDDDRVDRSFEPVSGTPAPGSLVALDVFVHQGDPLTALGLSFDTVAFDTPLGPMNAWHVPAEGNGWVIFVHGKSGSLRHALRPLTALHDAGMHVLVINYRNDPGMPVDPSGYYRQGLTEWEDLAGAVDYARAQGADDVAVLGSSMGGAIAASFLRESDDVGRVDAVVLDAPMLDFGAAVDHQADNVSIAGLGVPRTLRFVATTLTGWRFDVDWSQLDYTADAAEYETPILIFHGTADESVPVEPSRRLAERRPDLVELVEMEGAGHIASWNVGPEVYETRLVAFLEKSFG